MFFDVDICEASSFAASVCCSAKSRTDALCDDKNGGLSIMTFREASSFAASVCCGVKSKTDVLCDGKNDGLSIMAFHEASSFIAF